MASVIHSFDPPERFVAGTVGPPGQRTFFLQARTGPRVTSVALEKQQVSVLAERIDELLDELLRSAEGDSSIPAVSPLTLDDTEPLEQPIVEEFRAGTMTLSWDAETERVVVEVFPFTEESVVDPGTPEEEITWEVDVSAYLPQKRASLEAHKSQATDIEQFLAMVPEVFARAFGTEHYIEPGVNGPMRSGWPFER